MFVLSKDTRSKTLCDWVGVFCFLGCFLATVGLSCFGIANVLKKSLSLEAIDALLSMLKLLGFNCGLLLVSWTILYFCSECMLEAILIVQLVFVFLYALVLELGFLAFRFGVPSFLSLFTVLFAMAIIFRSMFMMGMWAKRYPMPFVRRAISKGVTWFLLASYGLGALFIATAALGAFGLLADPANIAGKLAASVVACGTILTLAVVVRLLRVLHASKVVHSTGLLGSLQSSSLMAFVISRHLGSVFFYYALVCVPLMIAAIFCISIDGWRCMLTLTNPFTTVAILSFPIYDAVCGTRMLILKKSIWDEWCISFWQCIDIPACSIPILLLQNTGLVTSFGGLFFAYAFGLKLFGSAQAFNPCSMLTCTAIFLANNILYANMAADAPAKIGIYLNARHAANLAEIPESKYAVATGTSR